MAVSLIKAKLGNLWVREFWQKKHKNPKPTKETEINTKSAVNNEEAVLTHSWFGWRYYLTWLLQCKELYSVANQFPKNIFNKNIQFYLLIMKQAELVEFLWNLTFKLLNSTFILVFCFQLEVEGSCIYLLNPLIYSNKNPEDKRWCVFILFICFGGDFFFLILLSFIAAWQLTISSDPLRLFFFTFIFGSVTHAFVSGEKSSNFFSLLLFFCLGINWPFFCCIASCYKTYMQ